MKNVFLEVINSVNLVNKKMNGNMKSLFSKYIKLLAVLLLSVAGVGQAWGATATLSGFANATPSATSGPVTVDKGGLTINSSNLYASGGNKTFSIDAGTGNTISSISLTMTGTNDRYTASNITNCTSCTRSGSVYTITISPAVQTVSLKNNSGAVTITQLVVTYETSGGGSSYSITYDCDGGSVCPETASGRTALPNPLPSGLTKAGYAFAGWFTDADKTVAAVAGDEIAANTTLYAKWTPTYTVTYNGNGNTGGTAPTDASSPYAAGTNVTVLGKGTLAKTGYTFDGWNTAANGSGTSYAAGATISSIAANTTLYAQWVEASCTDITPTLSYASTSLTVGGSNSATPTVSGNTGGGTVTYSSSNTSVATVNASGVVTPVAAGSATITASIAANGGYCADVATAVFTVSTPTHSVTISSDNVAEGSVSVSPNPVEEGATATITATPETGYEFDYWEFDANGGGSVLSSTTTATATLTMGTATPTIVAHFRSAPVDCYTSLAYSGGSSVPSGWTILSASNPTPKIKSSTIAMASGSGHSYSSGEPTRGMKFTADKNATITITTNCTSSIKIVLVEKNGSSYSIIQTWDAAETLTANIVNGRTYYLTTQTGSSTDSNCNISAISFSCSNYTITYDRNGGTGSMEASYNTVSANGFTPPSEKKFDSWNTAANGSGTSYAPGASATSNLTLYAIWVDCSAPAAPTISNATSDNKVTLTSDAGTTIYYTTDGSTPTESSTSVATGSVITIQAGQTITAFAKNECGTSSNSSKDFSCAIETMVWATGTDLPNGGTGSAVSKFESHTSVLSTELTGGAAEGTSLNGGKTTGAIVKISLTSALITKGLVLNYVKFFGKIEDTGGLDYSTDGGSSWSNLPTTSTGSNAQYALTDLGSTSIWLRATGASSFWIRNMQINVCEQDCDAPTNALSVSSSAATVTGGSGTLTITAANGNGGTIVPATPANGTITPVDATHFTYTPAGVNTPTEVTLTFNQAKNGNVCAQTASVTVTVNPNPNPDIYVSKDGLEVAAGSTVDFHNVAIASASTTSTTETYTFKMEDFGAQDLKINSITVTGTAFEGGCGGTCPTISNGDGGSTFTVSTVAGLAPGTYEGTVTINSNDPDEAAYTFNIRYVVVPKYTVTVEFKTTTGVDVPGVTATIDGTTTSTNPENVLVAGGLQTITCTEAGGYTFARWQIVGGASSSSQSYEFNVTDDVTIRAVYTVSDCSVIAEGKANTATTFTNITGTFSPSSTSSESNSPGEYNGETFEHAVKLGSKSAYIEVTATQAIVPGDSVIVITWSSGANKDQGFRLHDESGSEIKSETADQFRTYRYLLEEDDIESNGKIRILYATSYTRFCKIIVKHCNDNPPAPVSITPADNSNNVAVNSNIVVTLPAEFYVGTDCDNLEYIDLKTNTTAFTSAVEDEIIDNIKIYKFNEGTSSYDDVTSSFSGAAAAATGTGVTVTYTHSSPMAYSSQYRVEVLGVSNDECAVTGNISTFITGEEPLPQITVKDNGDVTTFANGGSLNVANLMPAEGYGDAVIKIYNTGTVSGTLDISNMTITGDDMDKFTIQSVKVNNVSYTPTTVPGLTKGGDPAVVTIRFEKASGIGTHHAVLNIVSNSTEDAAFALNLIGTKIDFTLPYVYESGCTDPVASETEGIRQDYTREGDVPSQIAIGAGAEDSGVDANVIPHYSLWSSLGGCSQNGESAVRVGDRSEGKAIHILAPWIDDSDHSKGRLAIGKVTVKWAANGLRKISIENAAGIPFTQSTGWETSNECHTTTAFINDCETAGGSGTGEVYISIKGPEEGGMAAISYLEITPCDPEMKSTACDLINVTSANQQGGTSYTAQGTDGFIAVTDNCLPGETFTPTSLVISNGATISPKVGVAQTINAQGYVTYVVTAADAMTKKEYHVYPECQPVLDNAKCYASEITINSSNGGDIYKTTGEDKKIAVVATASDPATACGIVMIDGNANGANHTVHYLDQDDVPNEGYIIDGPKSVCIGSVGTYRIINAPESNSPIYTWYLDHPNEAGFAVVGSEVTPASIASTLETKFGAKATYLPQEVGEVLGIGQFVTATVNVGTDLAPNNKLMDIYSGPELKLLAPDLIEDGEVSVALSLNFDFEDTNCRLLSGVASYSIKATSKSATPIVSVEAGCADENNRLTLTASQNGYDPDSNPNTDDIIEATKLDWTFSDPDVDILVASGNTVTVNIGKGAPDIEAVVIASNGCGTTDNNPTPITVPYGTPATTWIGGATTGDPNDWNNPHNWTRQVPTECTDVTIAAIGEAVTLPKGGNKVVKHYPVISVDNAVCDEITFNCGAGVQGLEKLTYRRAYVKNAYQRNRWYTLTNPLKEMVSGDYYFNGVPLAYMMKYDVTHSESGLTYTQRWTKEYNGLNEPLAAGTGFAYQVTNRNMRTPMDGEAVLGDQTVMFPRMTEDSLLITALHRYNPLTGKLMSATVDLTKTEASYRFAFDNASVTAGTESTHSDFGSTITVPIAAGEGKYSLIGNPMMTHLDLGRFYTTNSGVIGNEFVFWNGETNKSVIITSYGEIADAASVSSGLVAPMQAFFVKNTGNGTSVTFNVADHFVTDDAGDFKLRSADASSEGTLYVIGDDGETKSYLSIRRMPDASNGYVMGEDAEKVFNAYAKNDIYTLVGGVATDINHFSTVPYEVPLAVNTTEENGTVDFKFSGSESFGNVDVILVNKKTGEEINLKDENTYKFTFTKDEAETTLVLRFGSADEITTDAEQAVAESDGCDVQIFTKGNNTVRVMSSSNNLIKEISIFDAAGKLIAKEVATGNGVDVLDKVLNAGARNVVVTATTERCVKTEILQLK